MRNIKLQIETNNKSLHLKNCYQLLSTSKLIQAIFTKRNASDFTGVNCSLSYLLNYLDFCRKNLYLLKSGQKKDGANPENFVTSDYTCNCIHNVYWC